MEGTAANVAHHRGRRGRATLSEKLVGVKLQRARCCSRAAVCGQAIHLAKVEFKVSENTATDGEQCTTATPGLWKLALALLLLRMCIGWHFFSEGTKKLTYDQGREEWRIDVPTDRLFRSATGPFASMYKAQLPGFYDWENLLAVPTEAAPPTSEQNAERLTWDRDYASRLAKARKENLPAPIEFPSYAPYKPWAEAIISGLRNRLDRFVKLRGITEEQAAEAADLFVARHQQLADFLSEERQSIAEYRHELWRLENLQADQGAEDLPFQTERVATKRSEASALGGRLVSEVQGIERGFNNDLRGLLTAEQRADEKLSARVERTLTDPKTAKIERLNVAVTCLIIGVGVCLLLGLFTRLAAVGGMVFLASVMITQLPWVAGANTQFFYYQLVEFAALVTLLVSQPWRLPSLDGLLRVMWCKCCGAKG